MQEWLLTYDGFEPDEEGLREALCTLGNGYFATRGAAPESVADDIHYPGTYRAGLYDRQSTTIHGETVENEDLVNLPNWLPVTFRFDDGDWFSLDDVEILDYEQRLDLREGILTRRVRFRRDGRTTNLTQRRFVSMADAHIGALECTWKAEDWSGTLTIRSGLDGTVENDGVARYSELESRHLEPLGTRRIDDEKILLEARTLQSKVRIALAARNRIRRGREELRVARETHAEDDRIEQEMSVELEAGDVVTLEKVIAFYTSRDRAISEAALEAETAIHRAEGFSDLLRAHILAWSQLWRRAEIQVGGRENRHTDRTVNLYLFHVMQTVSDHTRELDVGVPARGWTGEAYRGHIFWDELFVFPLLNLRFPELTRTLLQYRYRRLGEARHAARAEGYEGAMFPWQSGSNGREESQRLHLNPRSGRWNPDVTHLQRHINVAIPYSIWKYYQMTQDLEFMAEYGGEMVVELARFWASRVEFDRASGRYEIRGVVGPDEYHTAYPDADEPGLNNNAYTNIMVVWVLMRALETVELLPGRRRDELHERLELGRLELEKWEDITRKMKVPFHGDGIISQFEGYEELEEFDWEGYRETYDDIQRLDRILEAEDDTPNRYKVSKQADVLMLFYLLSAEEIEEIFDRLQYDFHPTLIPRNIDYYLARTSHGSTLSGVVHAWVLARAHRERSWDFFRRALESDVSDIQGGTTPEGIHLGAMAGTVDLLQRCYSGLEARGDVLRLNPYLPSDLGQLCFNVQYRDNWLDIEICPPRVTIAARPSSAAPVHVFLDGRSRELIPGGRVELEMAVQEE